LDKQNIPDGEHWKSNFISALTRASGVVILISTSTIQSFLRTQDEPYCDNLLLEWILTLLLYQTHKIRFILPVLRGSKVNNSSVQCPEIQGFFSQIREHRLLDQLNDEPHAETVRQAKLLLHELKLDAVEVDFASWSVKKVVQYILDFQGLQCQSFYNYQPTDSCHESHHLDCVPWCAQKIIITMDNAAANGWGPRQGPDVWIEKHITDFKAEFNGFECTENWASSIDRAERLVPGSTLSCVLRSQLVDEVLATFDQVAIFRGSAHHFLQSSSKLLEEAKNAEQTIEIYLRTLESKIIPVTLREHIHLSYTLRCQEIHSIITEVTLMIDKYNILLSDLKLLEDMAMKLRANPMELIMFDENLASQCPAKSAELSRKANNDVRNLSSRMTQVEEFSCLRIAANLRILLDSPVVQPKLDGFEGVDLRLFDLSHLDLSGINFQSAILENTSFAHCILHGAIFPASLQRIDFTSATFGSLDLSHHNLTGSKFALVDLQNWNVRQVDLSGCDLQRSKMSGCALTEANLSHAMLPFDLSFVKFSQCDLRNTMLQGRSLQSAKIVDSMLPQHMEYIDLSHCILTGSSFAHRAEFFGTMFYETELPFDMSGANLSLCNLRNIAETPINFNDAIFSETFLPRTLAFASFRKVNFKDLRITSLNQSSIKDSCFLLQSLPHHVTFSLFESCTILSSSTSPSSIPWNFQDSCFQQCRFVSCNFDSFLMKRATFIHCEFIDCSFNDTDLIEAKFTSCDLSGIVMTSCEMQGAQFLECNLRDAVLPLKLDGVAFRNCDLHNQNFSSHNLDHATFANSFIDAAQLPSNLIGITFQDCRLSGTFERAKLDLTTVTSCMLQECNFDHASMKGMTFCHVEVNLRLSTQLQNTKFIHCQFLGRPFEQSDLKGSKFESCDMPGINLIGCSLQGGQFEHCDLSDVRFPGQTLEGIKFQTCNLHNQIFEQYNLRRAVFESCELNGCNFRGTCLEDAIFESCKLQYCNFEDTNLERATLSNSDAEHATFIKANLCGCTFQNTAVGAMKNFEMDARTTLPSRAPDIFIPNLSLLFGEWLDASHPISMRLIYRSKDHGLSAQSFHQHCDGKRNTIVLIHTTEGFVFGGFTTSPWISTPWHSVSKNCHVFLFTLICPTSSRPTMLKCKGRYPMVNCVAYGPIFGGTNSAPDICMAIDNAMPSTYAGGNFEHPPCACSKRKQALLFTGRRQFQVLNFDVFEIFDL
jgi:uncharacterized protein YjbI with pentapeptide repeats